MTREASASEPDAPTTELVAAKVGDRCANCQAPLASDQRYCLECGERRGKPRFSYATMVAQASPPAAASDPPARRTRVSSGATLVAGVATLLIALGVGVLIGHNNNTPMQASAPFKIVTLGGGGSGASSTGTTASSSNNATAAARRASAKEAGKIKPVVVHLTPKVQARAAAAARQVIGAAAPKQPTIQVGQKCQPGQAGCTGGKFTGTFFPGG